MSRKKINAKIKGKGWTVKDALKRWGVHATTYYKYCDSEGTCGYSRITDLAEGLPDISNQE